MTDWTDPRTWNVGELVTKTILDTHVRDNLKHLKELFAVAARVVSRQGGSSTHWNTAGTTTYNPTSLIVQAGTVNVPAVDTAWNTWYYGDASVTFPTAFTNKPIVFCTVTHVVANNIMGVISDSILTTGFTVRILANDDSANQNVSWLAIGE